MEKILVRVTRPDLTTYDRVYTNVVIRKDETGISVYVKDCNRMLAGFYPLGWAVELVKVEVV
jgi:hypothetical protein